MDPPRMAGGTAAGVATRLGTVVAAIVLAGAAPSGAEGVRFTVPPSYTTGEVRGGSMPADAVARAWIRIETSGPHALVVTASPLREALPAATDAFAAALRRADATVTVQPARPLCGATAYRVLEQTEAIVAEYRVVAIGDRLLTAAYSRGAAARADSRAIEALASLCSGAFQPFPPHGWRVEAAPSNGTRFVSANGASSLQWFVRASSNARMILSTFEGPKPEFDRDERCGRDWVHHLGAVRGGRWYESYRGDVRGFRYETVYERPAGVLSEPSVVALQRAFCDEPPLPASPART